MAGKKREHAPKVLSSKKKDAAAPDPERLTREIRTLRSQLAASQQVREGIEKRVGQLLHDGVCQDLSAVTFYMQSLKNQIARNNPDSIANVMQLLSDSVMKAVDSTHALSAELRK